MKTDIHPVYATATVKCACGNTFQTRSTTAEIHTDICSACHPFFTGKQKLIDTAGRVERKHVEPGAKVTPTTVLVTTAAASEGMRNLDTMRRPGLCSAAALWRAAVTEKSPTGFVRGRRAVHE